MTKEEIKTNINDNKSEDEKDANILAGLCYIPFCGLNLILILYVLLAKKGGQYAKFHALQGLFISIGYAILMMIVYIPFMYFFFKSFEEIPVVVETGKNFMQVWSGFMNIWLRSMMIMIPMMLIGILYLIASIVLAIMAFQRKVVRVPLVAGIVDKIVQ